MNEKDEKLQCAIILQLMAEVLSAKNAGRVVHSIELTRKMRAAALAVAEKQLPSDVANHKEQQVLLHAEDLSQTTARLVTAVLFSRSHQDETRILREKLRKYEGTYGSYFPSTRYDVPIKKSSYFAELYGMSKGMWRTSVGRTSMTNEIPLNILLSEQTGVIAPLSTDYHLAVLYRETAPYAENMFPEVKPAALDRMSRRVILPRDTNGQLVFDSRNTIGVFVDISIYGRTSGDILDAVKDVCPKKKIYGATRQEVDNREANILISLAQPRG